MKRIIYLFIIALGFSSCSDFLEEQSQDQVAVETAEQFGALMLKEFNDQYAIFTSVYHMTDDLEEIATAPLSNKGFKTTYTWQQEIEIDEDGNSVSDINLAWRNLYEDIAIANYVIESIDGMEGDVDEKQFVLGEAYFIRSMCYFNLINLYGQPYNEESKDTDLGVPLRTDSRISVTYKRSSVAEGYALIESDLSEARALIEESGLTKSKWHPSVIACDLLMSRVKLYQHKWDETIEYADKVINNGQLATLNTTGPFITSSNPEVLYAWHKTYNGQLGPSTSASDFKGYAATEDLLRIYETGDKRRTAFFTSFVQSAVSYTITRKNMDASEGSTSEDAYTTFGYQNFRVAEAYLNKAEALAQKGDASAIDMIKVLHAYRFDDTSALVYPTSSEEILAYVYNERRREFCFEDHHRWFDLRRMDQSFQPEIHHTFTTLDSEGTVSRVENYILYPGDLNYTLPIPVYERENNTDIVNNERNDKVSM